MPLVRAEFKRKHHQLLNVLKHDISQVLYLPFGYDDGNYARDRSGYNNHGTIYGATKVTGKIGDALSFDGVGDNVEVLDSNSLHITGSPDGFTLAAWVNTFEWANKVIVGKTGAWGLVLGDAGSTDNKIKWVIWGKDWVSNVVVEPNQWHHVVLVYDYPNAVRYIYKNGVQAAFKPTTGTIPMSTLKLTFAKWDILDAERYFKGLLDEVRIYNRALSQAEIKRIMNMRGL